MAENRAEQEQLVASQSIEPQARRVAETLQEKREKLAALIGQGEAGLTPDLVALRPLPLTKRERVEDVYDLDDENLVGAITTALLLGQPLVLAGEPGVGKTQLARRLKAAIGLHLHKITHVSTTVEGRKLLYDFDEVERFQDKEGSPLRDFIEFKPLGLAILWSAGPDAKVSTSRSGGWKDVIGKPVADAKLRLGDLFPGAFALLDVPPVTKPTASIVLLDEFDKAPRDTPNDLLATVEHMTFRIDELGIEVAGNAQAWPVLIITSNSERTLPDAFLRRCVFHWIDFPENDPKRLQRIVALHCAKAMQGGNPSGDPGDLERDAGQWETTPLIVSAVDILQTVRRAVVNKKPATAELIGFVMALLDMGVTRETAVSLSDPHAKRALGILLKTKEDSRAVQGVAAPA